MRTLFTLTLLAFAGACAPAPSAAEVILRSATSTPGTPPATGTTSAKHWCDVYTCKPCPREGCPPGGHEVSYCCPIDGECNSSHHVDDGKLCPEGKFLVICHWGMTNDDGTFTCFDER